MTMVPVLQNADITERISVASVLCFHALHRNKNNVVCVGLLTIFKFHI